MSSDPEIRGGEECLAGTRIPMRDFVRDVLEHGVYDMLNHYNAAELDDVEVIEAVKAFIRRPLLEACKAANDALRESLATGSPLCREALSAVRAALASNDPPGESEVT